jgi:response regulator of citrate/malate metabolism
MMDLVVQDLIPVAIVEDSPVMQERLKELYQGIPGVVVVGTAATVQGARELIEKTNPVIISLDLWLEDGSSLELIPFLREAHPGSAIIVITQHAEPFLKKKVTKAGAAHFVDKAEVFNVLPEIVAEYVKMARVNRKS